MKILTHICTLLLIASQWASAVNFFIDPSCAKIRTAIRHAKSAENIRHIWRNLIDNGTIPPSEITETAGQAYEYMHKKLKKFQRQKKALGKNYELIKSVRGIITTAAGSWMLLSIGYGVLDSTHVLLPSPVLKRLFSPDEKIINFIFSNNQALCNITMIVVGLMKLYGMPLCFYFGIKDIQQARFQRKTLTSKILNLTKAIIYIEPWMHQDSTQSPIQTK